MPVENLFTNYETEVTSLVRSRTHGKAPVGSGKASIIEHHDVICRCPTLLMLDRTDMLMTPLALALAHSQRFPLSMFYLEWSSLRACSWLFGSNLVSIGLSQVSL